MKKHNKQLGIPSPCTENWDEMAESEQGRFCLSCKHIVIDFTKLSDADVIHLIGKSKGQVCGRFNHSQLERELSLVNTKNRKSFIPGLLLSSVLAFGFTNKEAATPQNFTIEQQHPSNHHKKSNQQTHNKKEEPQNRSIIKGRVTTSLDHVPLRNVRVEIKGTSYHTYTKTDGTYQINAPIPFGTDSITLIAKHSEFEVQGTHVKLSNQAMVKNFELLPYTRLIMGKVALK